MLNMNKKIKTWKGKLHYQLKKKNDRKSQR